MQKSHLQTEELAISLHLKVINPVWNKLVFKLERSKALLQRQGWHPEQFVDTGKCSKAKHYHLAASKRETILVYL